MLPPPLIADVAALKMLHSKKFKHFFQVKVTKSYHLLVSIIFLQLFTILTWYMDMFLQFLILFINRFCHNSWFWRKQVTYCIYSQKYFFSICPDKTYLSIKSWIWTLLCQVRTLKSCEKWSQRKDNQRLQHT